MDQTPTFRILVHSLVYKAYWSHVLWERSPLMVAYSLTRICMEIEDRILMAAKNGKSSGTVKPAYEAVRWVNRMLTAEEKELHDSKKIDPSKTFRDLLALTVQGYNISIKFDAYSKGFQATIIPYNTASPNYGYGLSARSSEAIRAISLLLFKHFEVLQEDWQSAYKPSTSDYEG